MADFLIDPRNEESKRTLYEFLKQQDRPYLVKIESPKKRSIDFNSYYWGVIIEYIHDYTGDDPLNIHEVLSKRFLRLGKKVVRRSSNLNNTEFRIYTTQCRAWALEQLNIFIPIPENVIL